MTGLHTRKRTQRLRKSRDSPGAPVVRNPPANAGDGFASFLVWEDPTRLGAAKPTPRATTTAPARLEPCLVASQEKPLQREARTPKLERGPQLTATRESPRAETQIQHTPALNNGEQNVLLRKEIVGKKGCRIV